MRRGVKVRTRAGGKTTEMVEWLLEEPDNRAIVVIHERERQRLIRDYDLPARCVRNFQNRTMGMGQPFRELAVDNADMILQQLFPAERIRLATFSAGSFEYSEHEPDVKLGRLSKVLVRFGL